MSGSPDIARPGIMDENPRRRQRGPTIVHRTYKNSPESCVIALKLLMQGNAAGVSSTDGDDAKKGSLKLEVRATPTLPR
jgi:hypothetical protein